MRILIYAQTFPARVKRKKGTTPVHIRSKPNSDPNLVGPGSPSPLYSGFAKDTAPARKPPVTPPIKCNHPFRAAFAVEQLKLCPKGKKTRRVSLPLSFPSSFQNPRNPSSHQWNHGAKEAAKTGSPSSTLRLDAVSWDRSTSLGFLRWA